MIAPLPRATDLSDNGYLVDGWTPLPTLSPRPGPLQGRQLGEALPSNVCGYVSGDPSQAVSCSAAYCGLNSGLSALGCCTSSYLSGDSTYLTGCLYQTACYDSTALAQGCDSSCSSNDMILKCGNSIDAYCLKWTFTDIGSAILGCTDTPSLTLPVARTVVDDIISTSSLVFSSASHSSATYTPSAMNSVATNSMSTAPWVSTIATFSGPPSTIPTGPVTIVASSASGKATGDGESSTTLEGVSKHQEPIVAGAVGGAAALALIVGGVLFCTLRRKGGRRQ